jgi:hypothetical protein
MLLTPQGLGNDTAGIRAFLHDFFVQPDIHGSGIGRITLVTQLLRELLTVRPASCQGRLTNTDFNLKRLVMLASYNTITPLRF